MSSKLDNTNRTDLLPGDRVIHSPFVVGLRRKIYLGQYETEEIEFRADFMNQTPNQALVYVRSVMDPWVQQAKAAIKDRSQKLAKSESKEPEKPTETPELYASLLESLEWTPGARVGREWILISRNEEKLRPVLNLMRQIDPNGYHAIGKWKYRVEGDFLARYGSTKPKQTQFPGANDQERKI